MQVEIENIIKLGHAIGYKNRVVLLLRLFKKEKPVDIAYKLGISRAGLQKHLEVLLKAGLLVKQGSGRNTKYLPTQIAAKILQSLDELGNLLQTQCEVIKLDQTLAVTEDLPPLLGTSWSSIYVNNLKVEREERLAQLNEATKTKED